MLDVPLEVDGETLRVSSVSMGNPHAVVFVDDPERAPVERLGPRIERHTAFPNRVNVEFATPLSRQRIRQRTWERGSGETLACGSGACAVAVVSMLRGVADRRVVIELRGGELEIAWADAEAEVSLNSFYYACGDQATPGATGVVDAAVRLRAGDLAAVRGTASDADALRRQFRQAVVSYLGAGRTPKPNG